MQKSKILSIISFYLLLCFPVLASFNHNDEDPCFFRITAKDERKIYVLGSVHYIKIEDIFPTPAIEELKRVAKEEHPTLFTEHALSNKHAFQIIESDKQAVQAKQDWASSVVSSEYNSLMDQRLYTDFGILSEYKISDILKIEPWLAAPILSTHASIIFYPNFGGTEYNLENNETWRSCWFSTKYLEGSEHYNLLKNVALLDRQHNLNWIKNSFYRLFLMKSILQDLGDVSSDPLELEVLKTEKETALENMTKLLEGIKLRFKTRGWMSVNSSSNTIPESAIARNELWSNLICRLSHTSIKEDPHPYVIIVGDGHLAGFGEDKSFFSFLIKGMDPKKVERFINHSKSWKSVF